jgi:hypothetical protein
VAILYNFIHIFAYFGIMQRSRYFLFKVILTLQRNSLRFILGDIDITAFYVRETIYAHILTRRHVLHIRHEEVFVCCVKTTIINI